MNKNYVIYHLHSDLSNPTTTMDSVTKYKMYVQRAQECGMKALGFSEHGNIFEWYHKKCDIEQAGMKYIHACEVYITETLDKKIRDNYHCVLIAKNFEGVKELNSLTSKAFNRNDGHFYFSPRITLKELFNTSDNILVTTACLAGILNRGDKNLKHDFLQWLIQHKDRCYLEIQHHNVDEQKQYNLLLYNISKKTGIPLIAGTDTHSLNEEYAKGRIILQRAKNIYFDNEEGWDLTFKTYDELVEAYKLQNALPKSVYLEAIDNTNKMADRIETFELDTHTKYPKIYDNPEKVYKEKIIDCYKHHKYRGRYDDRTMLKRLKEEYEVYKKTGSIDFMLLQKYQRDWEHEHGIQCGYSRGSVSGSQVAYYLGITEMDSERFGLNFFRFMNPSRVTNADIDSDYGNADRAKVKYFLLHDHMNLPNLQSSEIITFNTIADKGAIRDVGRALNIPLTTVDSICKEYDENEDKFRKEYKNTELLQYVDLLNGVIVSVGSHPSGVLITTNNINEMIGSCTLKTSDYPVSCLNMKELDALMYVKLDILGLDNITVVNEVCKMVGIERKTPDNTDLENMDVWRSIRDDTTGIFQWESEGSSAYLKKFMSDETLNKVRPKIKNFSMLKWFSFGNGLIRPACASYRYDVADGIFYNNGLKELDEFLAPTLGHITMQEDIMQFLVKFCGYSMAESDNVRRCLDENTLILMGDGSYKKIKDIQVGDMVQSLNKNGAIEYKPVVNKFNNGQKKTYKLTTQHNNEILATDNHKFLTQRGWVELKNLTTNDYIMTPKKIFPSNNGLAPNRKLSSSDMFLIGLLIGDGCIMADNYNSIHFTNHELCLINKFKDCVNKRLENKKCCDFSTSIQKGINVDNIYTVYLKSENYKKSLNNLLQKLDLKCRSKDKKIPDIIMGYSKGEKVLNLLAGLFNTDGGYNINEGYIDYSSLSEMLTLQIKSLLLKYGIYSYVSKSFVKEYGYYSYRLIIRQPMSLQRFKEYILPLMIGEKASIFNTVINQSQNKENYYNYLLPNEYRNEMYGVADKTHNNLKGFIKNNSSGISDIKAKEISNNLYCPKTYELLLSDYFPVKIKSIVENEISNVYDIEVADNHNYIANNLIVHNCIAKKKGTEQILPEIKRRFIEYVPKHYNVSKEKCEKIIEPFVQVILDASAYAFSWNHSDSYSALGYILGWLRYYYPLEFFTVNLNINEDNMDKTNRLISRLPDYNLKLSNIKFGKSKDIYTCDNETNTIYKGLSSIKYLNKQVANELYELSKNNYDNFIDLLKDIDTKTSCNKKQLEILITLNFFSDFGHNHKLLEINKLYSNLMGRKQFNAKNIQELNIDEDLLREYAKTITPKTYKDVNVLGYINDYIYRIDDKPLSIKKQIKAECEFLGSPVTVLPNTDDDYYVITDYKTYSNKNKPYVTLYQINSGKYLQTKVKDEQFFVMATFELYDLIKVVRFTTQKKTKNIDGKWLKTDEDEQILSEWQVY